MSKYSDIEIQTAKNLLKEGYKWIVRENYGKVYAYTDKPRKNHDWNKCADMWWDDAHPDSYLFICTEDVPIFQSVTCDDKEPTSLGSIVYPQILDDDEKRYLEGVIRPFMGKVLYITKRSVISDSTIEYISIQLAGDEYICLPRFKKGTMYKGAEPDHRYTLEEIGL